MARKKQEVITFKAEQDLAERLHALPNRSEFIRAAILAAMENLCPLCNGAGHLSLKQKEHWEEFSVRHRVEQCGDCEEYHLVCAR